LGIVIIIIIAIACLFGIIGVVFVVGGMYQQALFEEYVEDIQSDPIRNPGVQNIPSFDTP